MREKIIIAGSGGQGIMLLGKVIAQAAILENKHVTWLPSYGPEVRGGTSHCMLIISGQEIGSPYIDKADSLIIMNGPSWLRFKDRQEKNGLTIVNSSLVSNSMKTNKRLISHPFSEIAQALGNIKVANMLALGCLIAHKKILKAKNILKAISDIAPQDKRHLLGINQKALKAGERLR